MQALPPLTLPELRQALDKRSVSALELTNALLSRIEARRSLNAFLEVCPESARAEAKIADEKIAKGEKSALLGIPVAVKDMILTRGIKTTCASKILSNFTPPYDATVTSKLRNSGAIIIGKTNLDEFAMGSSNENSAFGAAANPWDESRVPGGSSGGSASAVAARLVPMALGTDTGGSIRQPASLCGIVGIKPTYGRVSRYGVVAFASSLDQVGPLATTVRDCAISTQILAGHDTRDATSANLPVPNFEAVLGREIKGLRVGIPKEYFVKGVSAEVESSVRAAVAKLATLGAEIVEISLPHSALALSVYYIIAPAEASSNLSRYDGIRYGHRAANTKDLTDLYSRSRSEGFGREVTRRILIGTHVLSTGYYDAFYLKAQKVRTLITQDFKNAFASACDLIACPTAPHTAFKKGEKASDPMQMYLEDIFTIPVNLAGLPGISVPCGFDTQGLPIGLQLIGKPWDEETIFKAAYAFEQSTAWHTRSPDSGGAR